MTNRVVNADACVSVCTEYAHGRSTLPNQLDPALAAFEANPMTPPVSTVEDRFSPIVMEMLRSVTLWFGIVILAFAPLDPWILSLDESLDPVPTVEAGEGDSTFRLSPISVSVIAVVVSLALIAISVWLRKWRPSPKFANYIATAVGLIGLARALSYLIASPTLFRVELLAILVISAGCVFLSVAWFLAFALLATAIWFSVAFAVHPSEIWLHTTLVVASAITIGGVMLSVRRKSVLADVVARDLDHHYKESLTRRVRLGDVRSEISGRMLATTPDDFQQAVQQALEDVATQLGADHAFVCRLTHKPLRTSVIHEWAAPGITPKMSAIQELPIEDQVWFKSHLFSGRTVHIPCIDALPPEATQERISLERLGASSFLVVPLMSDPSTPWGYWGVVCDDKESHWSTDEIDLLQVVGNSFLSLRERIQAEIGLRHSEARFRRLFDANIIPVIFADIYGNITDANTAFLEMVGYAAGDLPLRWDQLTPPEWKEQDQSAVERILKTGVDRPWEKEFFHKDGRRIPILIGGAFVSVDRGDCLAFVLDLTEAKEAEQKIQQLNAELGRAARLSVMGEVAAGVAHEVHQPLAAIVNYANGARRRLSDGRISTAQLDEVLSEIVQLSDQAGSVIRNIRAFVKGKQSVRRKVNLNDVVRQCFQFVRFEIRQRQIEVERSLCKNLPLVIADNAQLMQILLNVVLNAAHALERNESPRKLKISTQCGDDGVVELRVADNGPGVANELRDRLFDQFATTKEGGLGLGLPISRSIAEAHDGTLQLERSGPDGTVFLLRLPSAN